MTTGTRFDRAWPSLVALVGTIGVVAGLLWLFGGELEPRDPEDDVPVESAEEADVDEEVDDDEAEPDEAEPTEEEQPTEPADPVTAPPELREIVGILNGTSITGLAGRAQERFQAGGWTVPAIDTTSREVAATTVYYPAGMEESARALMGQFPEITEAEPTAPGLAADRLIVILADDYAEAMEETG